MRNKEQWGSGSSGVFKAGRIITGLLCMCLLGGLIIYSFNSALDRNEANSDISVREEQHSNQPAALSPDVSVSSSIPVTDSRESESADTPGGAAQDNGDAGGADISVMPAEGNIIRDYSGSGLVYSETLNQYLAHKSVDIGAPEGTAVAAAESGTVTSAGEDERYGLTVVISHGNGLETSYSSLGEICVSEGDVVNKGDKIGTVGGDSLFEAADDPHLHFTVMKNGECVNPHEIWSW